MNCCIKRICQVSVVAVLFSCGRFLPLACAQTTLQISNQQTSQGDQEPNELSWQYFETARLPFANYKNWWKQLPQTSRDAAIKAAEKQGMIQPAPAQETSVWIQAEAFKGEGWKVAQTDGRTVLQHAGGHTGAAATMVVNVPKSGNYWLWSHWWNLPKYHNSFVVRIRPVVAADFKYGWQETAQGDYLNHRFAWQWFNRKEVPPVSYDADKKGFQWESTPMVHLPQGKVLITLAPLISSGPFTARRVDSFLLTQDPFLVPADADTPDSKAGDAASMIVSQSQPSAGSQAYWQLWDIRPGALPLQEAPTELAAVWREWRDTFINHLADGKNLTDAEQLLATESYFDPHWNLIGTPANVKKEAAYLQSPDVVIPGYLRWIEAESFNVSNGWEVTDDSSAGEGKVLLASYGNGAASASFTTPVPKTSTYRLWVRFAQIRGYHNYFEVSVNQNDTLVKQTAFHETPPKTAPGSYHYVWQPIDLTLKAGQCQIVLTKNIGKGPYAYRKVDCFVLTDNAQWKPNKLVHPVPAQVPTDQPVLLQAARQGQPVAWLSKNSDGWSGFGMTDWPQKTDQIATTPAAIDIEVQPGAVANRVLHLTNPSDKPITVTPVISEGKDILSWRVAAFQYQPAYGWQPMPLLRRHYVTIPPHLTASLWLNFDARQSNPGTQKATLRLGKQSINFAINVTGTDIRKITAPFEGGFCSPWPDIAGWQFFKKYDLTTVHGVVIPKAQMQQYGIKLFVVSLGDPQSAEHVADIVNTLQTMGLDYSDWAWKISDEPNKNSYPKWVEAAKALRAFNPKIRIWNNVGEIQGSTPEAVTSMSPWVDIFCPYINQFASKDATYEKLIYTLGNPKLLYTTPCFREKSPGAPLELLGLADAAIKYNRDGWDAFSLRNYYSYAASAWDEVNAPFGAQAISMYPGAWHQVIGSRNMEAVRVAVQRWKTAQVVGQK